jgi:hypothetical protein
MKTFTCSLVIILLFGLSCRSPRRSVAIAELPGTYVGTFKNPSDSFELRKDGSYKHISGPGGTVSEGKWEAELQDGKTWVSLSRFLLNWPSDVPISGQVGGWTTIAEARQDGAIEIPIAGSPYYYVKQVPRG